MKSFSILSIPLHIFDLYIHPSLQAIYVNIAYGLFALAGMNEQTIVLFFRCEANSAFFLTEIRVRWRHGKDLMGL